MSRELIFLSPYRLPTQHTLMLNAEDVAVFLNGYLALWHPAALRGATAPPRIASPYDHEQPTAGHVYAVPDSPPLFLPDDWEHRAAEVGATFFRVTVSREDTLNNLLQALAIAPNQEQGREGPASSADDCAPFFGLGLGYAVLEALFEAMDHLNHIAVNDFWQDVTQAVEAGEPEVRRQHLRAAAERLREAREILHANSVYLLDLALLEDRSLDDPLPYAVQAGTPVNLVLSAERLEKLARFFPEQLDRLRAGIHSESVEVCGGSYREREDALLPVESQLWNIRKGIETYRALLGQDLQIYSRKRFAASPYLPQLLHNCGLHKVILLAFDEGVVPQFRSTVIEWSAPDGKRVAAFTRTPHPADSALTYFHLAYHLSRSMLQDPTACLALVHSDKPEAPWYRDWLELHRLAPVFGQPVTLGQFFDELAAGEYPPTTSPDDFHSDYLQQLTSVRAEQPVSRFSRWARQRRRLDAAWTVAGLCRGVMKQADLLPHVKQLQQIEDTLEQGQADGSPPLEEAEQASAALLAERLVSRAATATAGYLLLNPCSFPRRIGLDLRGVQTPLPAPAKATQVVGDQAHVVVEVPALGFAWVPRRVAPGTPVVIPRVQLAEDRVLRNEFFEAEVDGHSGGLRVFRDARGRTNRIGQQLSYGPGSQMAAKEIKVTASGPALGEIVSAGVILDGYENVLATYRQRFRAWWGRPLLELRIEIHPAAPPTGYPWHAHYCARFAWRDERAPLFRAVNLVPHFSTHTRPETPDYLEIRSGSARTTILTGGLPFHQRHSQRMLDVILIAEGETTEVFDLALGLDLEEPAQAAVDFITSPVAVPTSKGPPHIGASGWLFHLDAGNLVLTSLRPAPDGADAVVARLLECRGVATQAELRCARNPVRAILLDDRDEVWGDLPVTGDAVALHLDAGAMQRVRIEFS
jgi:alpha-mannosidase